MGVVPSARRQCIPSTTMGCPRTVYVFLLLSSYFVLAEAGRGREALAEIKRRQTQARKSMEARLQKANRQRPNNGKPRKQNPAAKVAAAASATANVAAAAAFDGAFTAEEATVPAAAPPTTQPTDVLVDLRARLANLKRDIEKHAAARA